MKVNKISIEEEIIRLLKKESHSFLSGQALSKTFGLSRTAIWKYINSIKEMGYSIAASPAKGYRLNLQNLPFTVLEISSNLKTAFIGKNISFYKEIDSTNEAAREFASKGAAEGFAVVADFQKKGKGRLGRRWESPAGVNIYTSIVLRPNIMPVFAPQLTLVAAVAVAETIARFLNNGSGYKPEPAVKWPNDILINSKKVAGILTEMNSEMDRINFVVIGVGVNVNMTKEMFSEGLEFIATSLKQEGGKEISRTAFIQLLYLNMEKWYAQYLKGGFEPVRKAWTSFFHMAGKTVKVQQTGKIMQGIAVGIDNDGALLLREKSGNIARILSGDVEM
ncbi:MAG: biotin--[acetyl-CoA-carboxylase] ligase [Deltaproteobacteria bacterium]|nr:biotin--[acetyl-CoA-carboxylase] ligase [Deltaproteobacteria bacterium]